MSENKRVMVYDWLRLIATIFVVVGHSAYVVQSTTFGGVAYEFPPNMSVAYSSAVLKFFRTMSGWVYGFHMPLFFMLSGAVLALSPIKPFDVFFRSKIKRLLIPYFIYGWFFMLPVKYLANFYNKDGFLQALKGFLVGQDSGHLWFLTSLFWCMIAFVLIQRLTSKFTNSTYVLLLAAGIVYFLYNSYIPFDVLGMKRGLQYIFWFALGYAFEKERSTKEDWNIKKTLVAFVVLTMIEIVNAKISILNGFFVIVVGAFLTYIFASLCSRYLNKWTRTKLWKIVIRNLFFIYLFHDPLEYIVLRIFFAKNLLESSVGCYMFTFCRIFLIIVVSILLGEVVTFIKKNIGKLLA